MNRILLIPRLRIHNANALSSPYTIGFPALTAWLGGVHALQRKLNADGLPQLRFSRTAVACHRIDLQTYKHAGDYLYSIVGTGNPLDKSGDRPSFIEEARCHLDVSLAIETQGIGKAHEDEFLAAVNRHLPRLKWAGGDSLGYKAPQWLALAGDNELANLTRKLMPSYVLKQRRDLMAQAMTEGQDAIDALLDYLAVHYQSRTDDDGHVSWTAERKAKGWIVPIAAGFHGVSALGHAEHQRDQDTPHRFAESLVTLGEFVMPHRLKRLDELLWHSRYDADNHLYLIEQHSHNA